MKNSDIKVFVIEDNELYSKLIEKQLKDRTDYQVFVFLTVESMLDEVKSGNKPHLVITDYYLGHLIKNALQLVDEMKQIDSSIPIVVMTSQSDLKLAVNVLKNGAFDFIVKDSSAFEKLVSTVYKVAELVKLKEEINLHRARSRKDIRRLSLLVAAAVSFFILFSFWY